MIAFDPISHEQMSMTRHMSKFLVIMLVLKDIRTINKKLQGFEGVSSQKKGSR